MILTRTSKHSIVAMPAGGARIAAEIRDHTVLTDQPERGGGTDTAPTPLELLSASLASCIALYVHRYCESHGLDDAELGVEVKPFWRENPGRVARFEVVVHLPASISAEHRAAIEEVARGCPVHNTFTHSPELTLQVREAVEAGAGVA